MEKDKREEGTEERERVKGADGVVNGVGRGRETN